MRRTPTRPTVVISLAGVALTASLTRVLTAPQETIPAQQNSVQAPGIQGQSAQLATMQQYCVPCHNDRAKTAGVSFEGITPESIGQHADVFEKAVRKLRGRVMPPPGARQPDAAAVDSLVSYLEDSLDRAATQAHIPDQVVLHRLNRKEYANAVRDLLAVNFDASEVLPADDVEAGFDNIATALQVSPSFIEQYVIAARAVAVKAVGRPDARPGGWTFRAGPGTQLTHVPGLPLGTRGGILANVDLPSDGEYQIDVADMATHIWGNGMEFENPLVVTLDNKPVYETVIGGEEDMKLYDQVQNGALDRVNARLKKIRFFATAGPHKIGVAFKRRTFAESDDQLQMFAPGGGQDRLYRVNSFQLQGPFGAKGISPTPSRERIFSCRPDNAAAQELCAKQIITSLARRAYRRPVSAEDVSELLQYYEDGTKDVNDVNDVNNRGFEGGIRSAITGLLASPFFLYRGEHVPSGLPPGATYAISDLELASKLSFFVWNTIPDEELLQLGINGKLSEPSVLDRQVRRMLADPRSMTLASNFVLQWLDMKRLDEIVPDSAVFPYASGRSDPRDDFRTELTLFADSIFREDRSVVDLLRAKHTYLNERVALHYGITDVKGDRFRRVELEQSARWGLLGKGAVLMAAAYPNRTSPVLRGAFILRNLLGVPPANPPQNVPTLNDKDIGTTRALTVREMIAKHRSNPTCASCHAVMDPLGLALENFDATGMWRDRDRYAGAAIDSSGELPDGTPIKGPDDLRKALLRRPEQFVQTFTEGLLTYATGRKLEYFDMPTVRRIVRGTAGSDYRFSALVQAVVRSEQFRMRRVSGTGAARSPGIKRRHRMYIFKKHVTRRTVLKGVGATIALPLLDAMNPAATAWAQTAAGSSPKRLAFIGFPHGAIMDRWSPAQTGTDYQMSPILQPLEPFRQHLTIVSGLRNKQGETPEPHGYIEMTWLTCVKPWDHGVAGPDAGVSADQLAARHIGQETRLPSLELTTALGAARVAWRTPTQSLPQEGNPRAVFQKLFGQGDTDKERAAILQETGSILDRVKGQAARLQASLGVDDRVVVGDYLDSVREIERRVQMASQQDTSRFDIPDAPVGTPNDITEHFKLMFDLMALAFQADITRVITFSMDREASMRTYTNLAIAEAFHPLSHHGNNPQKQDKLVQIQKYHTEVFAKFVERLAKAKEGDGTVLDHSTILFGSNMSNSDKHNNDPLPAAILGHAHGRIKGGQHVKYPQDSRFADLLVTLFDRNNIPVEKLGDSGGIFSEL